MYCFAKFCIFPLASEANFLEQNNKVAFRHPDEIPESWTIIYMQLVLNTTVEQPLRPHSFAYFGRLFLLITNIYTAHMPAAASLHWLDRTSQVGVDTKYCTRTVHRHCTLAVIRSKETSWSVRITIIEVELNNAFCLPPPSVS